jgi:hypothetical protein
MTITTKKIHGTVHVTMRMSKPLHSSLKREAAERRISVTSLVEQCVRDHYDPERAQAEQLMLIKEIRSLDKRMGAVNFSNRVIVELFTLSMKNLFATMTPPTPAQKAAGEGFYTALLNAVSRNLSDDTPVLERITNAVIRADDPNFSALDPSTQSGNHE